MQDLYHLSILSLFKYGFLSLVESYHFLMHIKQESEINTSELVLIE